METHQTEGHHHDHTKLSVAGLLITIGIIFGDIGTSPLYVLKAVTEHEIVTEQLILGALSCIFWTLTLQTTVKYVLLTLRADNKGEGGIFSLYTLVRRRKKWLMWPAIIGGSALLADGIITPPISVSSAIEGLRYFNPEINTVPIVIVILFFLFFIQQFGTTFVGRSFGPIMLVWFLMLGVLGVSSLSCNLSVFKALNPYYAYDLLVNKPHGFWILGAVFLCTTGAEALYSDLGHCGRENIRISWIFVKVMLILNYFGQGAFLLNHLGESVHGQNPFFSIVPEWFKFISICVATLAAIVASQALISGSFTLINEAIRLNYWPKVKIVYPTDSRGQLYIPSVNWLLLAGCIGVVLFFRESGNMEAAYGLSIVICMLMTTILLSYWLQLKRVNGFIIIGLLCTFLTIEFSFLIANLSKFPNGGWLTLAIGLLLISLMFVMYKSRQIRNRYIEFTNIQKYLPGLKALSEDVSINKSSTHLVFMTSANNKTEIESKIMYSIMQKQPKRADIYWFVHVDVMDSPNTMEYKVTELTPGEAIRVDFRLGFRVEPRINLMFRKVVQDMVKNKEIDIISRYESLNRNNVIGDFKFVVIEKYLSNDNDLPVFEKIILDLYFFIKEYSLSEEKNFGLDTSNVLIEKFPLVISQARKIELKRIYN